MKSIHSLPKRFRLQPRNFQKKQLSQLHSHHHQQQQRCFGSQDQESLQNRDLLGLHRYESNIPKNIPNNLQNSDPFSSEIPDYLLNIEDLPPPPEYLTNSAEIVALTDDSDSSSTSKLLASTLTSDTSDTSSTSETSEASEISDETSNASNKTLNKTNNSKQNASDLILTNPLDSAATTSVLEDDLELAQEAALFTTNCRSELIFDSDSNNAIFPPQLTHKFVPTALELPPEIKKSISPIHSVPDSLEEASNWPVAPWLTPGFIMPPRDPSYMVANGLTRYPEAFGPVPTGISYTEGNNAKQEMIMKKLNGEEGALMSHEERQKLLTLWDVEQSEKKKIDKYVRKHRPPLKTIANQTNKMRLIEDEGFQTNLRRFVLFVATCVYVKWRILPYFMNEYNYVDEKDVELNRRLAKLPIEWREDGDITHENIVSQLT